MQFKSGVLFAALATIALSGVAEARDQIRIVGSSTVYPFATTVAEAFGKAGKFKTPVIESTGTGGGMKLFCAGIGEAHPDITNASRRITASEFADCSKAGISITEIKIGYDGIVVASAKGATPLKVTTTQLFLALAKEVAIGGKKTANPYKQWSDIDASLPKAKIEVLGPPPTSGTRDAFVELVMNVGCADAPGAKDAGITGAACAAIREDGAFIEAGENDNLIVQKLEANKNAFGIFGYSYLDQNSDKLQGATINGVAPRFEDIASGKYPVSRPLFFYVKKENLNTAPGIVEYINEFTSEKAWGEDGYLARKGLIPMPPAERKTSRDTAVALNKLAM
jgi:phosphate transport system substrate-binding protein